MSLIADVRRITAEYMGKISAQQRLLKEHEKSRENFSEARFAEIERQLGLDMEAIKDECERKVWERVERYKAAISTADALNGSDLTDDAKLLNGDYPLTVNDLDAMIDRSAGNRTMEKLIHDYAREHGMSLSRTFYSAEQKSEAADGLVSYARSCCQRPEYFDMMGSDEYFEEALSEAIKGE